MATDPELDRLANFAAGAPAGERNARLYYAAQRAGEQGDLGTDEAFADAVARAERRAERDPLVPDERVDGSFCKAASEQPAWDRAHHDVAAERYWGLADYYRSAAIREHTQGEAPGDRDPSPAAPGSASREVASYITAGSWAVGHAAYPFSHMYEDASEGPACSRSGGDVVFGWLDYKQAAMLREATRGEGGAGPTLTVGLDLEAG